MRLLIDENLAESLVRALATTFPDSLHVRSLGYGGAADTTIWQLALSSACTLLTRDEDFLQLSILNGAPPKVILLRTGNCSTAEVVSLLQARLAVIIGFLDDEDATILALGW